MNTEAPKEASPLPLVETLEQARERLIVEALGAASRLALHLQAMPDKPNLREVLQVMKTLLNLPG